MEKKKKGPFTLYATSGTVLRGALRESRDSGKLAEDAILERGDSVKVDEWEDAAKLLASGRFSQTKPEANKKTAAKKAAPAKPEED